MSLRKNLLHSSSLHTVYFWGRRWWRSFRFSLGLESRSRSTLWLLWSWVLTLKSFLCINQIVYVEVFVACSFITLSYSVKALGQVDATTNIKLLILNIQSCPYVVASFHGRSMARLLCKFLRIKTRMYTCLTYLSLHSTSQTIPSSWTISCLLIRVVRAVESLSQYLSCLC